MDFRILFDFSFRVSYNYYKVHDGVSFRLLGLGLLKFGPIFYLIFRLLYGIII